MAGRLPVAKTYKLFIDGAFPRSESGRTFPVHGPDGTLLANAARASRKDLRDAVRTARAAQEGWAARTAYNRGQVLYRVAEMLEGRRAELATLLSDTGLGTEAAEEEVEASIDRWVWYAGWSDKVHQVLGTVNPVAGPYFNFTVPEPTGVVGLVAPARPALLGLVSRLVPAIVGGNAVVVVTGGDASLIAVTLGEVLATSDVPAGVVNVLTGERAELLPWLISHLDVNAVDLTGADDDLEAEVVAGAAANVKRVVFGDVEEESPYAIADFLEMKTLWHPIGR
ncbi:MAG: aldehyde dehydrogenase family protein [Acidimicrobiales bacterium]|nr:aldehyde dehydrogenase family protein [Acidimicrobiales bacterium]